MNDAKRQPWECAAHKQDTDGGNEPADCDWPLCGCDPAANKVLDALNEHGFELIKKCRKTDCELVREAITIIEANFLTTFGTERVGAMRRLSAAVSLS